MKPVLLGTLMTLMACGSLAGCNSADNPKMMDVPPPKIQPDTSAPPSQGASKEPYGANKKYQDMMKAP